MAEIRMIRTVKTLSRIRSTNPLVTQAASVLLDYPLSLFLEQQHLSVHYRGVDVDNTMMTGTIVHKEWPSSHDVVLDPPSCCCGYFSSMGLPCRHYICLAQGLYRDKLPLSAFHRRWTSEAARLEQTFVLHEEVSDAYIETVCDVQLQEGAPNSSASPQDCFSARNQQFREVNRLYGHRKDVQEWLKVCLSGKEVIAFPVPVVKMSSGALNDPADCGSRQRKRRKAREEMAAVHGHVISVTTAQENSSVGTVDPAKQQGRGRPKNTPRKRVVGNRL